MAVTREFVVKLLADSKGLISDFQAVRGETEKTFGVANEKLLKMMPTFKLMTTAAAGVFGGLVAGAGFAVKAAAEAEAGQQRLAQILLTTGKASQAQVEALNDQAEAMENMGVVTAGNITTLQAQLATFDLTAETIQTLTPAIADYVVAEKGATATAEDFKSMTNGLAQALNGQFAALTRVGFVLDDTTEELISNGTEAERAAALVEVLNSTYGGFNASLRNTTEGQLQAFRNSLAKLQEDLGKILLPLFNAFARALSTVASFAAQNTTAVAALLGVLGTLSLAVLALAGYLKVAAFQKKLLNDQFTKSLVTFRNAEGGLTAVGKAAVATGKAFAVLAAAQGAFAVLNEISDSSAKTSDQMKLLTVALLEFSNAGQQSTKKVLEEFLGLAQAIGQELRLKDIFIQFGREFQFLANGLEVDIELVDEAFRKFLDSDPAKAQAIVDALEDQLAVTDPATRAYQDLKEAVDRYRGSVNLTLAAQGKLNTELSKTSFFSEINVKGLADIKVAHNNEARARLASADSLKNWNTEAQQLFNKASSGKSAVELLAEAKKKLKTATRAVSDAQIEERNSNERVADAQKKLELTGVALTKAQEKLAQAIRGYGKDSKEGREATARLEEKQRDLASANRDQTLATENVSKAQKKLELTTAAATKAKEKLSQAVKGYGRNSKEGEAAARALSSAQRDLQRANNQVTDAIKRVSDAEKKLAELRDKKADPNKVVDAEFSLEKARFDVEEATLGVAEAEQKLADAKANSESTSLDIRKAELDLVQAKFRLRDAIRDVGAEESNLEKVRSTGATAEEIAEAERELEDAKLSVQDALDQQKESQEQLTLATDEYRQIVDGLRETDKKFIELTADVLEAEDDRQASLKDLEEANLAVEDAQIRVKKAQDDLLKEKDNYRKVVEGLMDTDQEYIDLSADVIKATDDQTSAAKDLRDAQEGAARATRDLQDAEEQLRLSRKEQRLAQSRVPGRAFGGPVAGGRPYMVGERGPELFVPTSSGTIIPNNRVGGGGVVVNVTVNAGMGTSGSQVGQEIVDVLRQYTRVSGPLSQYVTV